MHSTADNGDSTPPFRPAPWSKGDRVRDRYTGRKGEVLGRLPDHVADAYGEYGDDASVRVEWDDGSVAWADGYDWERIHPLEELAEEAE